MGTRSSDLKTKGEIDMAYCSNCGQEVQDGVKFCNNCGAPLNSDVARNAQEMSRPSDEDSRILDTSYPDYRKKTRKSMITGLFGIGLLILAIVTFFSDPPVLTMALGFIIVAGAIVCLVKRFRLKGFTIASLVIACFCIFAAIIQATESGWFSGSYEQRSTPSSYAGNSGSSTGNSWNTGSSSRSSGNTVSSSGNSSTANDDKKDTKKDTPAIGVDPDLKAFLDSYEAFIDEYIDFMSKYMKDPITMMSEYSDMMKKYEDFAKKCDEYDSDDMSTADAAYYLEVTTRCTVKMMEIYK